MNNEEDIINLPHHISKNHPRMSMQNRAAQFSPFKSLSGYENSINEENKITIEKKILSPDEIEKINKNLEEIKENKNKNLYKITYFKKDTNKKGGIYLKITDTISKIYPLEKYLITTSKIKINFEDIEEILKL